MFGASRVNIAYLSKVAGKVNVHLRDPRQATLSYVHFLSTFEPTVETFQFIYPDMPENFFDLPLEEKIDWGIDHWLPLLVEWINGWVEAESKAENLAIRFSHFEDMVKDSDAFVEEMLDFFQIPKERFFATKVEKSSAVHFRKGETNEWQSVFTPAQLERSTSMIPAELRDRFGWAA